MGKRWKIFTSLFAAVATLGAIVPAISSCSNVSVKLKTKSYSLDALTNTTLNQYTSGDIIYAILNNNSNVIDVLLNEVESNIKKTDNNTSFAFTSNVYFSATPHQEYNSSNPTYTNLVLKITDGNTAYNITLENMFVMSSTNFVPPSNYSYSFNQVDLYSISNVAYNEINNSIWTSAFNASNSSSYIIPPSIYEIKSKTYQPTTNTNYGGIYTITYGVATDYVDQIKTLSNASSFKDIVVVVNLSPYIGKVLETSFKLDQSAINSAFGDNTTIDTVRNMYELDIYEKLKDYVATISTVQPLRDCISKTDSTKVEGYQLSNSITSPNTLYISFQTNSDSLNTYTYTFVLEFSN